MTRTEYFQQLSTALSDLDTKSREELLNDLAAHFDEGAQSGLSEEEIAARLGDPAEMAKEYRESVSSKSEPASPSANGNVYDQIKSIRVDVEYPSVCICCADVPAIRVECHDPDPNEAYRIRTYQEGSTLVIRQKRPLWFLGLFHYHGQASVTITVPRAFSGPVSVSTVSGWIQVTDLRVQSLGLNTVSGDIRGQGLWTEKLNLHMVSGALELFHSTIDEYTGENVSGRTSIQGIRSHYLAQKSVSGRFSLQGQVDQQIKLELISGRAQIQLSKGCDMKVSLTSGNCDLTLPQDASFTVHHSGVSGRVRLGFPAMTSGDRSQGVYTVGNGQHQLRCSAVSGNFNIQPEA